MAAPCPVGSAGAHRLHGGAASANGAQPTSAESGSLLGVTFASNALGYPGLTILDETGSQVGSAVLLGNAGIPNSKDFGLAGTAQGWVAVLSYPSSTTYQFIPASAAGVADAGAFPSFSLSGKQSYVLASSDSVGTGGLGGVGVGIFADSGLTFAYVQADGMKHVGPVTVLPPDQVGSLPFAMTNYNGSFVLVEYDSGLHSAKIVGSGCP
jgi:hypothetical protein